MVQASMNFTFFASGCSRVVVGTINPQHLQAHVAAVEKNLSN